MSQLQSSNYIHQRIPSHTPTSKTTTPNINNEYTQSSDALAQIYDPFNVKNYNHIFTDESVIQSASTSSVSPSPHTTARTIPALISLGD